MSDLMKLADDMISAIKDASKNNPDQGVDCVLVEGWLARILSITPLAYLHTVVSGDDDPDQALSFSPDSFPLEGTCGYRSIGSVPLYGIPPSTYGVVAPAETTDDILIG